MKTIKLRWILAVSTAFIVFQSCSTDTEGIETENLESDAELLERRGRPSSLDNDVVVEWNELILEMDRYATGMRPNAISRAFAYINLAAYETAVDNMDNYTSNTNRLEGLDINDNEIPRQLDVLIALNACYSKVVDHFIYNVPDNIESKISILTASLKGNLDNRIPDSVVRDSEAWGQYVADQVIAYSLTDTAAESQIQEPQPTSYEPPVADGYWTYSGDPERALFPYWGSVRTFVISSEETSSVAPYAEYSTDASSDFYAQMVEVYESNNTAREENNDDLWVAEFWSDDVEGLMMSPPGRQISIAKQLIEQKRVSAEEAIVLLLKLGFSLNDAAVSSWADKYEYMVMRPSVFIQDNIDDSYQTNLFKFIYWPNPSFPGYPSGHSTFASAAAGVFIDAFGNVEFTDETHDGRTEFLGDARHFDSLSDMAEENAFSRIPLGVHVRMDCTEGYRLGYEISDAINALDLTSRDRNRN